MQMESHRVKRNLPLDVVFVGELTVDLIIVNHKIDPGDSRIFERTSESSSSWLSRLAVAAEGETDIQFCAGGSIGNVAAAYAHSLAGRMAFVATSHGEPSEAHWPMWWPGYDLAALDLTARGISVCGRDASRAAPAMPGCIATLADDGTVTHLVARQETEALSGEVTGDLLVIRSDHLKLLRTEYLRSFPKLAILLSDDEEGTGDALAAAMDAQASWIFCRRDQVARIAPDPRSIGHGLCLIGTSGHEPVYVRTPEDEMAFEVDYIQPSGSDLGAGDAYMGAFLRMAAYEGASYGHAHQWAAERARAVLASVGAREDVTSDLNRIFPASLERRSRSRTEGAIIRKVHRSPGLSIVTGGQSGVEDLVAHEAARAGIVAHVIMPEGRRREDEAEPDNYGSLVATVRVHELSSPSFRYRTWASVYLADAVILVDYLNSEGSAETQRAAEALNRPLINVGKEPLLESDLQDWLGEIAPEAVLIAGNRGSLLRSSGNLATARGDVQWIISQLLRCIRSREASVVTGTFDGHAGRIVTPEWLWENPYIRELAAERGLVGQPVFLPPRDVARALEEGLADIGITWPGLLRQEFSDDYDILPLGSGASYYGFVGKGSVLRRPGTVGVQYLNAYARTLSFAMRAQGRIIEISGSAEMWVQSGLVDSAFDTLYTGRAIDSAGLDGFWPVSWESAAILVRRSDRS
jgi:hypothetical protein